MTGLRDRLGAARTALGSAAWWLRHRRALADAVRARGDGLRSLTPIRYSSWHRGGRYFRGVQRNGQVLFIKTDGVYRLMRRVSELNKGFIEYP